MVDTNWIEKCRELNNSLMKHSLAWPFLEPVDPIALNLPTYFDVIESPMDFSTMKIKLENEQYESPIQYKNDLILMFQNAIHFNQDDLRQDSVGEMAKKLLSISMKEWNSLFGEESSMDWNYVVMKQEEQKLLEIAQDRNMIQRWKRNSFVAKLNRKKLEKQHQTELPPIEDNV